MLKINFFAGILKVNDENSRIRIQDPDPDPLVWGMDPRIRIRIHPKMSWIRNTGLWQVFQINFGNFYSSGFGYVVRYHTVAKNWPVKSDWIDEASLHIHTATRTNSAEPHHGRWPLNRPRSLLDTAAATRGGENGPVAGWAGSCAAARRWTAGNAVAYDPRCAAANPPNYPAVSLPQLHRRWPFPSSHLAEYITMSDN